MVLGDKGDFAVECIHEPEYHNDHGWVFGRMCIWARGIMLGDLTEPACLLNVTEGFFEDCLGRLDELHDETIDELPNEAVFKYLHAALYLDDDRTSQQVFADVVRYRKFDFLTSWRKSFDGTGAFLLASGNRFRIFYDLSCGTMGSVEVTRDGLVDAMQAFLRWMGDEKRAVPAA